MRRHRLVAFAVFSLPILAAEDPGHCREILSVSSAIKRAAKLDGQVICVQGWVHGRLMGQDMLYFHETLPVGVTRDSRRPKQSIGTFGGDDSDREIVKAVADQQRAASFDKMEQAWRASGGQDASFEVVYRGILGYKRGWLEALLRRIPADSDGVYGDLRDALQGHSYSVELIPLELIKVRLIWARK